MRDANAEAAAELLAAFLPTLIDLPGESIEAQRGAEMIAEAARTVLADRRRLSDLADTLEAERDELATMLAEDHQGCAITASRYVLYPAAPGILDLRGDGCERVGAWHNVQRFGAFTVSLDAVLAAVRCHDAAHRAHDADQAQGATASTGRENAEPASAP